MDRRRTALTRAAATLSVLFAVGGCGAAPAATTSPNTADATALPASAAVTPSAASSGSAPASEPPNSRPQSIGSWTRLHDLTTPLASLTALELLDGRVLVLDQSANAVSDLGGPAHPAVRPEILDPRTGTWRQVQPLNAPRSGYLAVRLDDGRVLVAGGNNGWYGAYSSTKVLDPASGSWAASSLLGTARIDPVGTLLGDGTVLIAGGRYSEGYANLDDFEHHAELYEEALSSAERYNPSTGRWTPTGSLRSPVGWGSAAFLLADGQALVNGDPCQVYDPVAASWRVAGPCAGAVVGSASVLLADGSLLTAGGWDDDDDAVTTVRRFDPTTGRTTALASLPAPRGELVARLADGRVLVAGGAPTRTRPNGEPSSAAFLYDPLADSWSLARPMPFADSPATALLLRDGSVLVVGGTIPPPRDAIDVPPTVVGWAARFTP